MVARRSRQRHEYRGHARHRELGNRPGAGAAHGQRGPGEQCLHVWLVRNQLVGQRVTIPPLGVERGGAFGLVARSADVPHRHVGAGRASVVAADRGAVDRAGALRATVDRQQGGSCAGSRAMAAMDARTGFP
jgi:hypothetical protein